MKWKCMIHELKYFNTGLKTEKTMNTVSLYKDR